MSEKAEKGLGFPPQPVVTRHIHSPTEVVLERPKEESGLLPLPSGNEATSLPVPQHRPGGEPKLPTQTSGNEEPLPFIGVNRGQVGTWISTTGKLPRTWEMSI